MHTSAGDNSVLFCEIGLLFSTTAAFIIIHRPFGMAVKMTLLMVQQEDPRSGDPSLSLSPYYLDAPRKIILLLFWCLLLLLLIVILFRV
jgi:hypothetical protein